MKTMQISRNTFTWVIKLSGVADILKCDSVVQHHSKMFCKASYTYGKSLNNLRFQLNT